MPGNFDAFLSSDFFQSQCSIEPYLGPNCLHNSSADDTNRQRFNPLVQRLFLDHDIIFYF